MTARSVDAITSVFPPQVTVGVASKAMWTQALHPDEYAAVATATATRRQEFAAGRACARPLLRRLGLAAGPIPKRPDGAAKWPLTAVGSISHCAGLCAVAVAEADVVHAIGLDVELAEPLEPAVVERVCSRPERRNLPVGGDCGEGYWAKIAFSAKEAFFKCYYPLTERFLEFGDVTIRIRPRTSTFLAELAHPGLPSALGRRVLAGRFVAWERFVACGVSVVPTTNHAVVAR